MSILKDWREDTNGYRIRHRVVQFFSPEEWLCLHKWRKQRANRGWSDRDTWGAGDHLAKMTAEMLQYLNDRSHVDWPEWFKLNIKENVYKDLQSVVDDINTYLDFTFTSWADGLYCESSLVKNKDGSKTIDKQLWYDEKTNKLQTEASIKRRIDKWHKEFNEKYKKAQDAMQFVGRHFSQLWD